MTTDPSRDGELVVEDRGAGVWLLRLNRPGARNALSIGLRDEISTTVDVLGPRHDVKVVVLTGAGTTFCAGFDLTEFGPAAEDPELNARLWASSDRFHHTLLRCPVPVVCALNGPALAGGFDLATMCDVRIAQPGVWFRRPEIDFAVDHAVPLYEPLRELIGGARARELCLTSRRVDLDEAERIGLVNAVAAEGQALDVAFEFAAAIAVRPSHVVRATKAKFVTAARIARRPTLGL